jgi:hypothetical protein
MGTVQTDSGISRKLNTSPKRFRDVSGRRFREVSGRAACAENVSRTFPERFREVSGAGGSPAGEWGGTEILGEPFRGGFEVGAHPSCRRGLSRGGWPGLGSLAIVVDC